MSLPRVPQAGPGERQCRASHRAGWLCTRPQSHKGAHVAHGDLGTPYYQWRGGRP